KILKPDLRRMQAAITAPMAQYAYATLITSSQTTGQNWKYTFVSPAANWFANNFDDSQWSNGVGGFGAGNPAGFTVRTPWNTPDIWLRRTFNPGALTAQQITSLFSMCITTRTANFISMACWREALPVMSSPMVTLPLI